MIRIDMTQDTEGRDIATAFWNGSELCAVSRSGASMALARHLVAAGCPDGPWEAGRKGKRDFYGPSLHRLAKLTVSERHNDKPRIVPWTPHPLAVPNDSNPT